MDRGREQEKEKQRKKTVCSALGPFPQHLKVSLGPLHLPCLPSNCLLFLLKNNYKEQDVVFCK